MSDTAVLILVTVLGPTVAFLAAFLLFYAIRISSTPRGSQLIGLAVSGVIWAAVAVSAVLIQGLTWRTAAALLNGAIFTWLGWSQFRRAFPHRSQTQSSSV